jgi:ABC-type nitrate/sulfonate/bicarbonate transport system substrate-binding protein
MTDALTRRTALGLLTAAAAAPAAARAQGSSTIRIAAALSDPYAQPYYGLDSGMFKRAGLDVEILTFSNAGQIIQACAGGSVDIGLADMIQIANAAERGLPYRFFAGAGLYTSSAPTTVLCVAKDSPVKTAKDLNGQTVAVVALSSISSLSVQQWLKANGADISTIKIYELPFAVMAPSLQHGTVAAAFLAEPFLSTAKDQVRWLGKAYDAIAKEFYIAAWFASKDWLAANPAVAKRLQTAVYDVARWSNANHDQTAVILSKYSKLGVDRVDAMTRAVFTTSLSPNLMQPVLDIAARYDLIKQPIAARMLMAPAAN